ncbi:YveK family protein [Guptibacillus hwajinpoensis]|uniref:Capsular polysaccharide biosynthesis protein n=1 Tax=Guptibacillus hwajinpoensis TaxID=208199 RepID=A0ABU0JZH9_9BACL|nr:Wzz/FepE/Etk N-terminal domain-containing protein [Alkalihalobacillus hemicentroti]MDQ0482522.1 capsular polysaccharide biosynthesis protein [Alkalihalobacillus hemicentroti]
MDQRMDLKQFFEILKRRYISIVLTTLVVLSIAIVASIYIIKPTYQATEYILIGTLSNDGSGMEGQQIERLLASTMDFIESPIVDNTVKSKYGFTDDQIEDSVSVQNTRNSQIINVIAKGNDSEKAQELAHAIASTSVDKMDKLLKVNQVELLSNNEGETKLTRVDNPIVNIVIGLAVGVFMGIGLALIREHFDDSVLTSDELKSQLGLRVLGELDFVDKKVRKRMFVSKKKLDLTIKEQKGGQIRA